MQTEQKPLTILQLTAENIKRISVVDITPKGPVITITGPNESGKSSVLDSIEWALAGAASIQEQPIREGEEKASIRLDLGQFIVERRFTKKGSTIAVKTHDGAKYDSPQTLLDQLLSTLAFDPLEFTRMDEKRKLAQVRKLVTLDVDIDQLDRLNKHDFEERTEVNRRMKVELAKIDATVPENVQENPYDEEAIVTEIQQAGEVNSGIELERRRREKLAEDIGSQRVTAEVHRTNGRRRLEYMMERVAELEREIQTTQERCKAEAQQFERDAVAIEEVAQGVENGLRDLPALAEPVNVEDLRTKLRNAKATNQLIGRRNDNRKAQAEANRLDKVAAGLTASMAEREKKKREAIAAAKFPVDGLGFDDNGVTFKGHPFEQASSAMQLRVSVAIAMAANPKLRVIRIKDGSLLDPKNMKLLAELAGERGYQVWVEAVYTDDPMAIVMEEGAVKGAAAPAETK